MSFLTRSTELGRFREGAMPKIAIAVLLVIPLIYGALYLWAFWAPTDNLDKLPVAIVNLDEPAATSDGETLAAGADVVDQLREGGDLDWRALGAADAERAVADGDVYFAVTIPRDFSSALAGLQDAPRAGRIDVVYNDSNSFLASTLGKTAMVQLRDAVAETVSQTAAEQVLVGVERLSDGTRKAAGAAADLHGGTTTLAVASSQLHDGIDSLADGASQLAGKAPALAAGAAQLSGGTAELAEGSARLAAQAPELAQGAAQIATGAAELAEQLAPAGESGVQLLAGFEQLHGGAADIAQGNGAIAQLAAANPEMTLAQLDAVLQSQGVSLEVLAQGSAQLSAGAEAALPQVQALAAGLPAAADGAQRLADGAAATAEGAGRLSEATVRLAEGAAELRGGAGRLSDGTQQLLGGAAQLDRGAQQASVGGARLADGVTTLDDGAAAFAQQLADGAEEAPAFATGQSERIAETIAAPVQLSEHTENAVQGFGEGFAPFFIALASFVGALITWLILRPLPRRPLASNTSGLRSVLAGFGPAALIGLGQVVVMMLVLVCAIGMRPAHWLGMAGFMLLVTLAFLALQQTFIALFGTAAGRVVSLVLLMLQLSSSGGTYPVETTPGFFQALHPFMPASYVVTGLRQLIGGGIDARFWGSLAVMVGLLVGSLAISAVAARRQKVWTVSRLHPSLAI